MNSYDSLAAAIIMLNRPAQGQEHGPLLQTQRRARGVDLYNALVARAMLSVRLGVVDRVTTERDPQASRIQLIGELPVQELKAKPTSHAQPDDESHNSVHGMIHHHRGGPLSKHPLCQDLTYEWDFQGIPHEYAKRIQPGIHDYWWTPIPLALMHAVFLQSMLAIMFPVEKILKDNIDHYARNAKVMHAMCGPGGSTMGLATCFRNVEAGDLCKEQLDTCRRNIESMKLQNRVKVESEPVNVLRRKNMDCDVVVLEPVWPLWSQDADKQGTVMLRVSTAEKYDPEQKVYREQRDPDILQPLQGVQIPAHDAIIQIMKNNPLVKIVSMLAPYTTDVTLFERKVSEDKSLELCIFEPDPERGDRKGSHKVPLLDQSFMQKYMGASEVTMDPQTYVSYTEKNHNATYGGPDIWVVVYRKHNLNFTGVHHGAIQSVFNILTPPRVPMMQTKEPSLSIVDASFKGDVHKLITETDALYGPVFTGTSYRAAKRRVIQRASHAGRQNHEDDYDGGGGGGRSQTIGNGAGNNKPIYFKPDPTNVVSSSNHPAEPSTKKKINPLVDWNDMEKQPFWRKTMEKFEQQNKEGWMMDFLRWQQNVVYQFMAFTFRFDLLTLGKRNTGQETIMLYTWWEKITTLNNDTKKIINSLVTGKNTLEAETILPHYVELLIQLHTYWTKKDLVALHMWIRENITTEEFRKFHIKLARIHARRKGTNKEDKNGKPGKEDMFKWEYKDLENFIKGRIKRIDPSVKEKKKAQKELADQKTKQDEDNDEWSSGYDDEDVISIALPEKTKAKETQVRVRGLTRGAQEQLDQILAENPFMQKIFEVHGGDLKNSLFPIKVFERVVMNFFQRVSIWDHFQYPELQTQARYLTKKLFEDLLIEDFLVEYAAKDTEWVLVYIQVLHELKSKFDFDYKDCLLFLFWVYSRFGHAAEKASYFKPSKNSGPNLLLVISDSYKKDFDNEVSNYKKWGPSQILKHLEEGYRPFWSKLEKMQISGPVVEPFMRVLSGLSGFFPENQKAKNLVFNALQTRAGFSEDDWKDLLDYFMLEHFPSPPSFWKERWKNIDPPVNYDSPEAVFAQLLKTNELTSKFVSQANVKSSAKKVQGKVQSSAQNVKGQSKGMDQVSQKYLDKLVAKKPDEKYTFMSLLWNSYPNVRLWADALKMAEHRLIHFKNILKNDWVSTPRFLEEMQNLPQDPIDKDTFGWYVCKRVAAQRINLQQEFGIRQWEELVDYAEYMQRSWARQLDGGFQQVETAITDGIKKKFKCHQLYESVSLLCKKATTSQCEGIENSSLLELQNLFDPKYQGWIYKVEKKYEQLCYDKGIDLMKRKKIQSFEKDDAFYDKVKIESKKAFNVLEMLKEILKFTDYKKGKYLAVQFAEQFEADQTSNEKKVYNILHEVFGYTIGDWADMVYGVRKQENFDEQLFTVLQEDWDKDDTGNVTELMNMITEKTNVDLRDPTVDDSIFLSKQE